MNPMPLPEPVRHVMCERYVDGHPYNEWRSPTTGYAYFTDDQLRARDAQWQERVKELVAAERERCARIVETQDTFGDNVGCWFETLAAKIRDAAIDSARIPKDTP